MADERMVTDRTSIETDWLCGMRYWWYKFEGGGGIVPAKEATELLEGRDTHLDLADYAAGVPLDKLLADIEEKVKAAADVPTLELLYRRMGWLIAWDRWVEPRLKAQFPRNLMLEKELVLDRDPLWIATTPDRVVESDSGLIVVDDYKTARSLYGWAEKWPYAIQCHIQLKAVEEELGRKVAYGRMRAIYKGEYRDGRLAHPYVWGWKDHVGAWTPEYRTGLTRVPVWEYPGGIREWVVKCGEEIGTAQFPLSQPIFLNDRLLEDMLIARTNRERQIRLGLDKARSDPEFRKLLFEQRFGQCRHSKRYPCPYLLACHNAAVNQDPLAGGEFVKRTPHHELEMIELED